MNTYEKRNLAEQVEKNKQDILKHFQRDEVLADFGIRIIGQVATVDELYRVPQEGLEYGDAYAVGTKSPFNYFIWTRANNLSPVDYWFDFGEIAIAGPQGPKGDRGAKGATGQSTTWISIFDLLNLNINDIPLDTMVLEYSSGNVYQVLTVNGVKTFSYCLNIKGPVGPKGEKGPKGDKGDTGPQGPKGATGDVGGFINIAGIVGNEYELPDPAQVQNLTVAFLVGSAEPYNLYIQVGSTSATAEWLNAGPLNVATMVTVNGQYQNTWDADTKVDKIPVSQASGTIAYTRDHLGNESYRGVSASPNTAGGSIPVYNRSSTGNGILKTSTPEADNDCANKVYVDNAQYWSSLEQDLGGMDDEFYISLEAGCQYQVSASIKITYSYRQDGRDCTEHINFNTGSLYVPDEDSVHSNVSVSSFVKLDASASTFLAPNFQGMYVMVGEHYQDELYEEGPNGATHYTTRVYVAEPQAYPDIEVQELHVILTWKKVY